MEDKSIKYSGIEVTYGEIISNTDIDILKIIRVTTFHRYSSISSNYMFTIFFINSQNKHNHCNIFKGGPIHQLIIKKKRNNLINELI